VNCPSLPHASNPTSWRRGHRQQQYRGRLQLSPHGLLWQGRHPLSMTLHRARWEADQADEVLGVAYIDLAAIVAVYGASGPWAGVTVGGVMVAPSSRLPDLLQARPAVLRPDQVAWPTDPGPDSLPTSSMSHRGMLGCSISPPRGRLRRLAWSGRLLDWLGLSRMMAMVGLRGALVGGAL
jgi:hypothetical protein